MLTKLKRHNFKEFKQVAKDKLYATYLPADYPDSVAKEYLPFSIYGNVSAVACTAMLFLSTQSLFVALGG